MLFVIKKSFNYLKPFIIQVDKHPDIITVKYVTRVLIDDKVEDFTVWGFKLDRNELLKRKDYHDYSHMAIHAKEYDLSYMNICDKQIREMASYNYPRDYIEYKLKEDHTRYGTINRNGYLINLTGASFINRVDTTEAHVHVSLFRMFHFFVKFRECTFDEMPITISMDPDSKLECNEPIVRCRHGVHMYQMYDNEKIKSIIWRPVPKIIAPDTVKPDETIKCQIQLYRQFYNDLVPGNHELFLEGVNGYLPKTRIMVKDGYGECKYIALGLEPGDTMKLKVGFKKYPGLDEKIIHVES